MDPNENLKEQLELAERIYEVWDDCPDDGEFTSLQKERLSNMATRMAELVDALDEWIRKGGALPDAWKR